MPKESSQKKTVKTKTVSKTKKTAVKKVKPATYKINLLAAYSPKAIAAIFACGLALLILSGLLWFKFIYQSPQNVFWGMIENNLATQGITKETEQSGQGGSLKELTRVVFGNQNYVHSLSTLVQPAANSEVQGVTTETIGTLDAQYVRYRNIKTGVRADGKKPDVTNVEGFWGKTPIDQAAPRSSNRMLAEGLIGTVPFANLPANKRKELVDLLKNNRAYATDYTVVRKKESGRTVYVYTVKINPRAYVSMLKEFASRVGLGVIDGLDPANYANAKPVDVDFSIDPISHQLVKISYKDGSSREEKYSSYGAQPNLVMPTKTIPMAELQGRIQNL